MSSAGGSQKKRKAVVRKESADSQESESYQLNDMDVDMNENKEELSFIPSVVSRSAGWHEPKFMCDTQCHKDGFKYDDIASVMVEDDGEPPTKHLCKCVDNLMQDEKKEPGVALWKAMANRTHATSLQTLVQSEARRKK